MQVVKSRIAAVAPTEALYVKMFVIVVVCIRWFGVSACIQLILDFEKRKISI